MNKPRLALLLLITLGLICRTVFFDRFQYWSDDEAVMMAGVIHSFSQPALAFPNVELGLSQGPLFVYLSLPWFAITNFSPQLTQLLGLAFYVTAVRL